MIAVIRIHGKVKLKKEIADTLNRLGLKRKYSCVVFKNPTESQLGMIKKIKDFVAFGEINEETLKELKEKRGKTEKLLFRLHPPRGGIKSKEPFPKGVLGNNKEKINDLIKRML